MKFAEVYDEAESELDELPDGPSVVIHPPAKGELTPDDTENALLSMIPLQAGNENKANYLAWRTMGFAPKEACEVAQVTIQTVHHWRKTDPDFADQEKNIKQLQKTALKDLHLLWFSRNMALIYHTDFKVLRKAAISLKSLSPEEIEWNKMAQRRYQPGNLIELERALGPEIGQINSQGGNILVYVDGRVVDTEAAKRAGARELLDQFRINKKTVESAEAGQDGSDSN